MVLTGGPGTGKTTTTMGIISAYQMADREVLLAAPTGRAAKRMSEATELEAKTIHRLLEYSPMGGYQRNEENPLDGDVLIVDECSMIDLMLMYNLLKAIPENMTLIMVGDIDQLLSVSAGNVLKDIINSECVPVVRLTRIFRQAQNSRIIMNAHRINEGKPLDMRGGRDSDFFFAERSEPEEIVSMVVQYVSQNLPKYYGVDPIKDIQVLSPMKRGVCGTINLNIQLQAVLNARNAKTRMKHGGTEFWLHDKVMQVKDNYTKDVFNGDIGIVSDINNEDQELTISFDGKEVTYESSELDEVVLAYATTIHKAQGSEFSIVVMPFSMSHYMMLQRNLLYTGVTRAKKVLFLIGEKRALSHAIHNETTTKRNTKLAERLKAKNAETTVFLNLLDNSGETTGEVPAVKSNDLYKRLAQSKFRNQFFLDANDRVYIADKGLNTIREHACQFVAERLAPAFPVNDGKQTPMKGHPVFIAQHATGTCCRECLAKLHKISKGRALTQQQQDYIVNVIMGWIQEQLENQNTV